MKYANVPRLASWTPNPTGVVRFHGRAMRLIAVSSFLFSLQIRANADNFRTHWPVAWLNVNGVTQIEVYVPPRGMPVVRLNWMM